MPRLLAGRPRLQLGLLALVAAYAGVFAAGAATAQPAPAALAGVDAWLAEHGATYGLGTYWDANVVTVSSHGAIAVRSIETSPDGVEPFLWHSTTAWYDPSTHRATFVLLASTDATDRAGGRGDPGQPGRGGDGGRHHHHGVAGESPGRALRALRADSAGAAPCSR